ncbi:MAG: TetR/AcrR family transcriptional regulator [Clostridiales bacterium]|nr:TetR/AcrR family transcriptional regulator [Clostridiales bacterium]
MFKGTPELIAERREEIINACEKLYQTMSFKEITLKEIGNEVPFSRPTIYNYFETKEEIFLALFEREYRTWTKDLENIGKKEIDASKLAEAAARSLEKRALMLRLLSVNLYDMEENSRIERLVEFKKAYCASVAAFDALLQKALPGQNEEERRETLIAAFEFIHGVYPYAHATKKQIEAMKAAGVRYDKKSIYELSLIGLNKILK